MPQIRHLNPRAVAARLTAQVIYKNQSLTPLFEKMSPHQKEVGLIKALCFGVLRWYFTLNAHLVHCLPKPLKSKDADIHALLLIGLYQILYLKTPDHVVVMETVSATRALKKPWAAKLVNGVLRSFLRTKGCRQFTKLEQNLQVFEHRSGTYMPAFENDSTVYSHPQWLIDAIKTAWPHDYITILNANNHHPPLCIRVNTQKIAIHDYLKLLTNQMIPATRVPHVPSAIILEKRIDIPQLPGYLEGLFSVQDSAAQLAAEFLNLAPTQRILDACAAPGGKTLHILEKQPDISKLVAVDIHRARLEKARENHQRLNLPDVIDWIMADVVHRDDWWDKQPFDRILLDAPCSATGVIRRHPDIKLLRREQDIPQLVAQQTELLNSLWPLLKPNGLLLYTTCSILPAENEAVILHFLKKHPDAMEKKISSLSPTETAVGMQILTGFNNMDGFYFACIEKYPRR